MKPRIKEVKRNFFSQESTGGMLTSAVFLFFPFFLSRLTWGANNEYQSLFAHIPQAIAIAAICIFGFAQFRANKRQIIIFEIFSGLLLIHLAQTAYLSSNLVEYSNDYFFQGILLWAYLFSICLYASSIKVDSYPRLLHFFDVFAKNSVYLAMVFYLLYQITGVGFLIHFYDGFGIARLQGFFSEPSALAPISSWLLLSGIRYRNITSVGLGIAVCVLTFSPIVLISTTLALITYLIIFHPKFTPIILLMGVAIAYWILAIDCSSADGGESIIRAACGMQTIFSLDARDIFANGRLLSSLAIFDHLSERDAWGIGLGINSTSIFMPAYYGIMRDNSLPISMLAFYGVIGGLATVLLATIGLLKAGQKKNIFSIFWISFFWCSMINSAQGFISYSMLFVATIWLLTCPKKINYN